jgi:hypothetical protein
MTARIVVAVLAFAIAGCSAGGSVEKTSSPSGGALVRGGGGSFLGDLLLPLGFRGKVVIQAVDGKEEQFSVWSGLPS